MFQAVTLRDFPAPMSLCAVTSLLGVIITAMIHMIQKDHTWDTGWPLFTIQELIVYSLLVYFKPHFISVFRTLLAQITYQDNVSTLT